MSDDLVKRLRDLGDHASFEPHMHHTAADRIEELEAKLAMAVDALIWCSGHPDFNEGGTCREGWSRVCAPILAELTGGKDEW